METSGKALAAVLDFLGALFPTLMGVAMYAGLVALVIFWAESGFPLPTF